MSITTYSDKAMLATHKTSQWYPRKYDKQLSEDSSRANNAPSETVRATKRLFANEPAGFKAITAILTRSATRFKSLTLPWANDGQRLLSAKLYQTLVDSQRTDEIDLESACWAFVQREYADAIVDAQRTHGSLFDAALYPSAQEFPKLFKLSLRIDPLSDPDDFRVKVAEDAKAQIVESMIAQRNADMSAAVCSIYGRLETCLTDMRDRLTAVDKKDPSKPGTFRDTITGNLAGLLDLIPDLNLTADPQLDSIATRIRETLVIDPQVWRESPASRAEAVQDVDTITADLKALFGKVGA